MTPLANILLPVDFSERSAAAGRYAKVFACRFKGEVTMLHALPPLDALYGMELGYTGLGEFIEYRKADAQRTLDDFLADEFGSLPVDRVLVEGDPAIEIVRVAHEGNFDLVVMPTHGYGPFRRFVLGSVTAKVLHDTDCPVLTGTHLAEIGPATPIFFRNIVCAVDLGPQSGRTLAVAAQLAHEFHAKLTLVHALPPIAAGIARYFDAELQLQIEKDARERLLELAMEARVSPDFVVEHGEVPAVVKSAAESVKADLAVIGRHHGSGVLGRLRAHAYSIVRESPCPVLSV